MTHAAIHACLSKLQHLRECYLQIPNLQMEWLDNLSVEHVVRGLTHPRRNPERTYIYAGTVFQVESYFGTT